MKYRTIAAFWLTAIMMSAGITGCGLFQRAVLDQDKLIGAWTYSEQAYTNGTKQVYLNDIETVYTNGAVRNIVSNSSYSNYYFYKDNSFVLTLNYTNGSAVSNIGSWLIDDVNMVITVTQPDQTNVSFGGTNIYSNYISKYTYSFDDTKTLKITKQVLSYTLLMENSTPTNYSTNNLDSFSQYAVEYVKLKK
jgi:hypothetical protein